MIKVQYKLPRDLFLGLSCGVDSVSVLDFLSRRHNVTCIYVDHLTGNLQGVDSFLDSLEERGHKITRRHISEAYPSNGESKESFWRDQRYKIFHEYATKEKPLVTCHHLDDCVETWIWSCLHGEGKIIPYNNQNVIRPFRLNKKSEFISWADRHNLSWIEDKSNNDTKYIRNHIRHNMMKDVLTVNPGIHKVIAKKIIKEEEV